MPLLFGHDKAVADWVARQGIGTFAPPYTTFGVLDDNGHLIGGLVFWCFTGHSVALALAGYASLKRGTLAAIVSYVFDQLGCDRLEVRIAKNDRRLRSIVPRLGLVYEGTARRFYGPINGLIYSLTRDDLPSFAAKWGITQSGQKSFRTDRP